MGTQNVVLVVDSGKSVIRNTIHNLCMY